MSVAIKESGGLKKAILGTYDYKYLCMPKLNPWGKSNNRPDIFFGRDDNLGVVVALIMGLQHAFAMMGGIIVPPLLVYSIAPVKDGNVGRYLVNAALICSGICTLIQVWGIKLGPIMIGSGQLSVMGTSFTFLTIAMTTISSLMAEGHSWGDAYGKVIGTLAVCGIFQIGISFIPVKALRRMVPPLVSGIVVFLIGAGLTGSGLKNWGGGNFCGDNYKGILPAKPLPNCFTFNSTTGVYTNASALCVKKPIVPFCSGNGEVLEPFGDIRYVGMGLSVLLCLIIIELFGSPFFRSVAVVMSLLVGCAIAAIIKVEGRSYWISKPMDEAPAITFLWTETFKLGFYAPLIIPAILGFMTTAIESIGDLTATREASNLPVEGEDYNKMLKGGLLGDGFSAIFACLGMSMPNTTFAQNNGVIVLTRCSSKQAGYACGFWLIFFGVLGKFGGFITAIPNCILGGMTTFLFANVAMSGLKLISMSSLNRRDRLIGSVALGLGFGVTIAPQWATNHLWPVTDDMSDGLKGFREGVIIVLSTGFCVGALVAIVLNLILPAEAEVVTKDGEAVKDAVVVKSADV